MRFKRAAIFHRNFDPRGFAADFIVRVRHDLGAQRGDVCIMHHRLGDLRQAGFFVHQRGGRPVRKTHHRLRANCRRGAVAQLQAQRIDRDIHARDVACIEFVVGGDIEAGIDDRMDHHAAGIGLVGEVEDFPFLSQAGGRGAHLWIGGERHCKALDALDHGIGAGVTFFGEKRRP